MFSISPNGIIFVNRGDSFEIPVSLVIGGTALAPELYNMTQIDAVYCGIMEPNQSFENAIVKKKYDFSTFSEGTGFLKFKPHDTECLLPGKYYYQVKLEIKHADDDSDVITVKDKTLIYITE